MPGPPGAGDPGGSGGPGHAQPGHRRRLPRPGRRPGGSSPTRRPGARYFPATSGCSSSTRWRTAWSTPPPAAPRRRCGSRPARTQPARPPATPPGSAPPPARGPTGSGPSTPRSTGHPAGVPHHHLAMLAVRPDRQGRGTGTTLLGRYHEILDRDVGVPAYLEASDLRTRRHLPPPRLRRPRPADPPARRPADVPDVAGADNANEIHAALPVAYPWPGEMMEVDARPLAASTKAA